MADKKVKVPIPGKGMVDGTEVAMIESVERWTELKLADGTILRVKPLITAVVRIDNTYDQQGNPVYATQGGQAMVIGSVPDNLRQPAAASKDSKVQ